MSRQDVNDRSVLLTGRRIRRRQARRLFFEGLESRRVLSADFSAGDSLWQNHEQPLDANADFQISPLDFLVVANAINAGGAGRSSELILRSADKMDVFPDVNGDQFITALDALAVANWFYSAAIDAAEGMAAGNSLDGSQNLELTGPGTEDSPSEDPPTGDPFAEDPLGNAEDPAADEPDSTTPDTQLPPTLSGGSSGGGVGGGGSTGTGGDISGGGGGGSQVTCDDPPLTVSAPSAVSEYSVFTVAGSAKHAESVRITSTGFWSYVDAVGETPGASFNAQTGEFSRMLIYHDDLPAGTARDQETITVTTTGPCAASETVSITVENVDVQAAVSVLSSGTNEGGMVTVLVELSDAVIDGHTISVDWGDGEVSTLSFPDAPPHPPGIFSSIAFLEQPEMIRMMQPLSHRYLDDDPTGTPSDEYVITVKVSDNDLSSTTVATKVTIVNADPVVVIDQIIPLDTARKNDQIDESEGFRVTGTVTDPGIMDSQSGRVMADLNWDGDFSDTGETMLISGGGGNWSFDVTFPAVGDDGPSPGNKTASDPLPVIVEVYDDDTGFGSATQVATVVNDVPKINWGSVTVTFTRDSEGNIDSVTIAGAFEDLGQLDVHEFAVRWGDGKYGDGRDLPYSIPISGRSFSFTRRFAPEFGTSILRAFPITPGVKDDDLGKDFGLIDGKTHWSFDQAPLAINTKDLTPQIVQPTHSPTFQGDKWKGYAETLIAFVEDDSNVVNGTADSASALALLGLLSGHDFTKDLSYRATSTLDFMVTCDRATGTITRQINGGGGGRAIKLAPDGTFLGWDFTANSIPHSGPLGASTKIMIAVTPGPALKSIEVDLEAQFGLSSNVTFVDENGPQIEGPGGRIVIKAGNTTNYPGGLMDHSRLGRTYICRERLDLIKPGSEN